MTRKPLKNTSSTGNTNKQPGDRRKEQIIARLDKNEQVKQLLGYFQLSLTGEMKAPLFGVHQQFELAIYNDQQELTLTTVSPILEFLSQDLGFVNSAGYDAIKVLQIEEFWRKRLLQGALKAGKDELSKYLRNLRPLLMERQIYFYTTPISTIKTLVETGELVLDKSQRPLCALPMSIQAAELYGCTPEKIKELAPQVAWLIPMLIVYRKVKVTNQLIAYLDGWRALLTQQENERLYTAFVRYAPALVDDEISQLLLTNWVEEAPNASSENP